jgi:preprotein translocase subunit SecD
MRSKLAAVALVAVAAAGCSSSSSGGDSGPTRSATPTPTFTQLGKLAISNWTEAKAYEAGTECPSGDDQVVWRNGIGPGEVVACDPREHQAYLIAPGGLDQTAVDATTVGRESGTHHWTVFLQLTKPGARKLAEVTRQPYAIVYNGVVLSATSAPSAGVLGGLIQISGLSKHKAKRIAAALNPS